MWIDRGEGHGRAGKRAVDRRGLEDKGEGGGGRGDAKLALHSPFRNGYSTLSLVMKLTHEKTRTSQD